MAYATNFEQRLAKALNRIAHEYCWKPSEPVDDESIVDVVGYKAGIARVFVEVELKKDNPVENVVKIWRWAKNTKGLKPILFVHAFSALYANDTNRKTPKRKQFDRAVFIGQRMNEDASLDITYRHRTIHSTTRSGDRIPFTPRMRRGFITKQGGTSMHRAAEDLAFVVKKLITPGMRKGSH